MDAHLPPEKGELPPELQEPITLLEKFNLHLLHILLRTNDFIH
jgi:hypothetical protein